MKARYKVEGNTKVFDRLADARKHRKELKASLPDSVTITIYKAEEIGSQPHEVMWIPYE